MHQRPSYMFGHTSSIKAQDIIDVIEGKIMTQQHLMEEAPILESYVKYGKQETTLDGGSTSW